MRGALLSVIERGQEGTQNGSDYFPRFVILRDLAAFCVGDSFRENRSTKPLSSEWSSERSESPIEIAPNEMEDREDEEYGPHFRPQSTSAFARAIGATQEAHFHFLLPPFAASRNR
jgi:hypothetical protein